MPNLLKFTSENHSFSSYRLISVIFVVFVIVGIVIGFVFARNPQTNTVLPEKELKKSIATQVTYEGVVTYQDTFLYSEDKITYVLTDRQGKDIILLKSNDQKLEVSEGHYVEVSGERKKIRGGDTEYLLVNKLTIKNATN